MLLPALGVLPVRAVDRLPPLGVVAQVHRPARHAEDQRERRQLVRRHLGELLRVGLLLGDGLVPRCLDELGELAVGHLGAVHPEAVHVDGVDGVAIVLRWLAHPELTAGHPDHSAGAAPGRPLQLT
jgi:hypothetical protein